MVMDIEKFTERARGFLQAAQTIAIREFHQRIGPDHLLKALLDDDEGAAAGLIKAAGGEATVFVADVRSAESVQAAADAVAAAYGPVYGLAACAGVSGAMTVGAWVSWLRVKRASTALATSTPSTWPPWLLKV